MTLTPSYILNFDTNFSSELVLAVRVLTVTVLIPLLPIPQPLKFLQQWRMRCVSTCGPFINCSLLLALLSCTLTTEQAKIEFVIRQLTDKARLWGTGEWQRLSLACASFDLFVAKLQKVSGFENCGSMSKRGLVGLKGERTVLIYSFDIHSRASQSFWNCSALYGAFLYSLADCKIWTYTVDHPSTLHEVIELTIHID